MLEVSLCWPQKFESFSVCWLWATWNRPLYQSDHCTLQFITLVKTFHFFSCCFFPSFCIILTFLLQVACPVDGFVSWNKISHTLCISPYAFLLPSLQEKSIVRMCKHCKCCWNVISWLNNLTACWTKLVFDVCILQNKNAPFVGRKSNFFYRTEMHFLFVEKKNFLTEEFMWLCKVVQPWTCLELILMLFQSQMDKAH